MKRLLSDRLTFGNGHHHADVILMDEPCSALDPKATARVEELIDEWRKSHAIVAAIHNMQQASRVSQRVAISTSAN